MATMPRSKKSAAAVQHPIRIVPLHRPEAQRIAGAATPQLNVPRGGRCSLPSKSSPFFGARNGNKQRRARFSRT